MTPWNPRVPLLLRRPHLKLLLAIALVSGGCTAAGGPPGGATAGAVGARSALPYPTEYSPELLGPMTALGPCDERVEAGDPLPSATGLLFPDATTVVSTDVNGPLTQYRGFVHLTPIQLLDTYVRRTDIALETAEHEQFESELLYTIEVDGQKLRVFVKAQVACESASQFVAVIAASDADADLPTPGGTGG